MICKGGSAFGGKFQILASLLIIALAALLSPSMVNAQDITSGLAPLEEMKDFLSRLWKEFFLIPVAQAQTTDLLTGLIGHWKFDEGSGTTASDSSGNNNIGTLLNGPLWTTGKIGNALSFDGVDDVVAVGDPASGVLDFGTSDFTLSAWIKANATQTQSTATIIAKGGTSASVAGYWFYMGGERQENSTYSSLTALR